MTQAFGEAFERLRLSRALSPAELGRELGEYEGNISRWRRGGGIDVVRVRKIADYFGVDRGWLEELAGYPASQSEATVDPARLERFALVEQVAVSERRVRELHRLYGTKARVEGSVSPHRWRHSAASEALAEGIPEVAIRDRLGHLSRASLDVYLHLGERVRSVAAERASLSEKWRL